MSDGSFSIKLSDLRGAVIDVHDLPRVQWKVVYEQIHPDWTHVQKHAFWCDAQRQWLALLGRAMGDVYQLLESDKFLLLTAYRGDARFMLDFAERAATKVAEVLHEATSKDRFGKTAVLVIAGEAKYRQYVRYYYPGDRPGESAGICISDGDTHVAVPGMMNFKHVLVHELVHAHLAHLPIPKWVHEGIAQHVDRLLVTRSRLDAPEFHRDQHRAIWRLQGIQPFWSGQIFGSRRDDRQYMAYQLAEQLVNALRRVDAASFDAFLREANKQDAGMRRAANILASGLQCGCRTFSAKAIGCPTRSDGKPTLASRRPIYGCGSVSSHRSSESRDSVARPIALATSPFLNALCRQS